MIRIMRIPPSLASLAIMTVMATTLLGMRTAHASLTQQQDGFDTSPTDWWFEQVGTHFAGGVFSGSSARSPSGYGLVGNTFGGGSTSDWSALGKTFFMNGTENGGDFPTIVSC